MSVNQRRGLGTVYGFLVVYMLIMAGMTAISDISSSQASLNSASGRQQELQSSKQLEHIDVVQLASSTRVTNVGSTTSDLVYFIARSLDGTSVTKVSYSLVGGSSLNLTHPAGAAQVGVVTSLGNVFWSQQAFSPAGSCPNGTSTVTVSGSPSDAGTTVPDGVSYPCTGSPVQVLAIASQGFAFSRWSGTGNGSYSGSKNPVTFAPGSQVVEVAQFVPAVSLSLSYTADGLAEGGPPHSVPLIVSGSPQRVNLTVLNPPPGVHATFAPESLTDSLGGASSFMSLSFNGSSFGIQLVQVLATGADGQTAWASLRLQTTPPNGAFSAGVSLYPDGIGYPREHKAVYWKGVYYMWFGEPDGGPYANSYYPISYSNGWTAGPLSSMGSVPVFGYMLDVSQRSSQVFVSSVSENANNLCYNLGVAGGDGISFLYGGAACGGPQTPTEYTVVSFTGGMMDSSGDWWAVAETYDSNGRYHFEVLEATNAGATSYGQNSILGWSDVYVSPSFGSSQVVPQLIQLESGRVVVLYTTFTASSSCQGGDYFLYTDDAGQSWSSVQGPYLASGSSLCYDRSSGVALNNTLYVGGVNAAGELAYWAYDFGTAKMTSQTLAPSVTYAALGTADDTLVLAYTSGTCPVGHNLALMWSHDGGATWSNSGVVNCVGNYVVLEPSSPTFQIGVVSNFKSGPYFYPRFVFYTV